MKRLTIALIAMLATSFAIAAVASTRTDSRVDDGVVAIVPPAHSPGPASVSFDVTIDASTTDQQTGRLFRGGVPSTCAAPLTASVFDSLPRRYVTSPSLYNQSSSDVCATITVTFDAACDINMQPAAYLGSFDPTDITANYLGDPGLSSGLPPNPLSFEVTVPGGASIVVNVNDANSPSQGVACTATVSSAELFDSPGGGGGFPPDENFDEVTAPALPTGWTTAASGAGVPWVTATDSADTAPNAAYAPNMTAVSDMTLDTPSFTPAAAATLSFRHQFDLESGFDGAVLEISINGGAFQDFVDAGGAFTTGGYNDTISTCCSNPIAGRDAWSGASGGFVDVAGTFPAAAIGQPTVLRFRTADDSSFGETGWWVDTIHVGAGGGGTPIADITPTTLDFTVAAGGSTSSPLNIANIGGGTLNWSIEEAAAVQPASSSVPTANSGRSVRGTPSAWTSASPLPANLVRYAFAQDGDDLYVAGGVQDGTVVGTLYRYDTASDSWTTLAPMPVATGEAPTGAFFNGKLYVVGGTGITVLNIYDIATDTWSSGTPFPDAGGSYGAAGGAFNGKFFVAGGTGGVGNPTLWVYDIATDTWSAGTAVPNNYYMGGYQQVGQYVYMVGSYGDSPQPPSGPLSALSGNPQRNAIAPSANGTATIRLDMSTATGTWTTGPAWTMNRADFGLAYDPGTNSLYAIGGDANGGGFFDGQTEVDQLDISAWPAGTWAVSTPALPSALQANQAGFYTTGVAGGEIWSTGGLDPGFIFHNTHQYRTNGGGGGVGCVNPSDVPWLSESPTSGAVAGGDSQDSTISVDASALTAGSYSAHVCVTTDDPTHALVDVPVSVTVTGGGTPIADVTPASLDFTVTTGASASNPLNIANIGGGVLDWSVTEAATANPM
ncbi:MAG TPA: kelch repeat-containing protein, partial [Rhodanobacteraceae bacterium]|nr:kelch repeat-containing protein [Rhodanobacteraceae bacterium]